MRVVDALTFEAPRAKTQLNKPSSRKPPGSMRGVLMAFNRSEARGGGGGVCRGWRTRASARAQFAQPLIVRGITDGRNGVRLTRDANQVSASG